MQVRRGMGWTTAWVWSAVGVVVCGSWAQPMRDLSGVERAERLAREAGRAQAVDRPVLVVNGQAVEWSALRGHLAEAAGGAVVEEVVLDVLLSAEMERRGLRLTPEALEREGERLMQALSPPEGSSRDDLLERVRRLRGLGPERLNALVVRSARLRALVGEDFTASKAEVELGVQLRYGVAYRCRLLTAADDRTAARIRAGLVERAGGEDRPVDVSWFASEAVRSSTHPTGEVGGLVPRLSPVDPAYPAAIRQAVERLAPGRISPVIPIEGGAALVMVEERLQPRSEPDESARSRIEREIVEGKQRAAMEALAEELLAGARVTVFDESVRWAWEGRRRQ